MDVSDLQTSCTSPCLTAAGAARVAVEGKPPDGRRYYQTNGWTFWEFETETGERHPIEAVRKRYLAKQGALG